MKFKKNIFLLIVLVFIGCSKKKDASKNHSIPNEVNNGDKQFGKVVIIGKTDDLEAFKHFNIYNTSSFSYNIKNYINDEKIIKDSLFLVIDSISSPQFLDIHASSASAIYNTKLLVQANDTIVFEIKNEQIKFIGKNAKQNNFYSNLYNSTPEYMYNSYQGNINKYKQNVDSIYEKKIDFLNQYITKNEIASKFFINMVKLDLKYQHLSELISPRTNESSSSGYFNDPDGLIPIIQKEYSTNEILFDFGNYLGNITIDDFKNENYLNLFYFKGSLIPLIRYYFETSEFTMYSKEKLLAEKAFIKSNFDGKIEEYTIASLIFSYHQKGFGHSINNVSFLREMIREYLETYPKSSFKEDIQTIMESLESFDFKLSEAALYTKLIDKFGDTLTLKEIFSRSNQRIRVIDFWASWCLPCINEIIKAKSFKDKLSIENNVEWIYLSIDKDENEWLKKSKELEKYLNVSNQYLILGGNKSPLAKSLKVNWIPKYVVFNKQNNIIIDNAPRPSDSLIFKMIIDKLN